MNNFLHFAHISLLSFVMLQAAPPKPADEAAKEPPAHEAEGCKLPAPFTVPADASFLDLQCEAKGEVRWVVIGTANKQERAGGICTIGLPSTGGQIEVFAIAALDGGKLSEVVHTTITVEAPTAKPGATASRSVGGGSPPTPGRLPAGSHLRVILIDAPPALANSPTLTQTLSSAGHSVKAYAGTDPAVARQNLTRYVQEIGGPALLVQATDGARRGEILHKAKLGTEAEIIAAVKGL